MSTDELLYVVFRLYVNGVEVTQGGHEAEQNVLAKTQGATLNSRIIVCNKLKYRRDDYDNDRSV